MRALSLFASLFLVACGGGETAPDPAPKAAPAPKPEPKPEPEVDFGSLDDAGKKAHLLKVGKDVYETGGKGGVACMTCHMIDGKGVPGAFPPLIGQKEHMGDCAKHASIVLDGLTGEITVNDMKYNGVMVPQKALLDDMAIAAVITYERNSWGNDYGDCTPADVAAARKASK